MLAAQSSGNHFLSGLSSEDISSFGTSLASRELRSGDVLQRSGHRISEVVFPHSGVIVMRASRQEGAGTGIALIGRDGIIGAFAAHAWLPATCDCEVLIGGKASQMAASAFRSALDRSPTLRHWESQFDNALMVQAQQTALCNATHSVEARICRWLLEIQERGDGERIPLTQGTLAEFLGVRRTTVTLVAGQLAAAGAIDCRRGYIQVVDRDAIERRCCGCYARLKGNPIRSAPRPDHPAAAGAARALNP